VVIEDELSLRLYFSLEPFEARAWDANYLFGEDVSNRFPSTDFELQEETKCYATGRYTAAVFHLMRVLEVGLAALAANIGVDPENRTWEAILNGMQTKLNENTQTKPAGWKETEQFYSELMAHFRSTKNAWLAT